MGATSPATPMRLLKNCLAYVKDLCNAARHPSDVLQGRLSLARIEWTRWEPLPEEPLDEAGAMQRVLPVAARDQSGRARKVRNAGAHRMNHLANQNHCEGQPQ